MARAEDVGPGQVWRDAAGRRFQVIGPQANDGRFPVLNVDTRRQTAKGPRALVHFEGGGGAQAFQEQPSYPGEDPRLALLPPPGYAPPPAPLQPDYGAYASAGMEPPPGPYPFSHEHAAYDPERKAAADVAARAYAARQAPRHAPPRRSPPQFSRPAASPTYAPAPARSPVGPYPSELTAFVAARLAAMRPDHAQSTRLVGSEVARALAGWNGGQRR